MGYTTAGIRVLAGLVLSTGENMAARRSGSRKVVSTKRRRVSRARTRRGKSGNGMETFSMHAFDKATASMVGTLMHERDTRPSFALTSPTEIAQLDPETV